MNRGEIGDYPGLTIETVSRSITKLRERGLIALPNGYEVAIVNIDGLRDLGKFGQ
jgi:CRP/FNR family transcriptional regulator